MDLSKLLSKLYACCDSQNWCDGKTLEEAYEQCERGDWMLWFAARVGVDRKLVVLAACDCAETALKYVPEGEDRPRAAIEMARAWTRGEATTEQVCKAAADAAAAAADAAAAAAAYAAAAAAADAADDAAYAAAAADAAAAAAYAYAAAAADDAAYAAAAADARATARRECAELVRRSIPLSVVQAAIFTNL